MDKISSIKQRLLQFLNIQGVTKVDFCNKTDISYSNLKGKSLESELGGEQIGKILTIYPELNPDWLLLGKGEMLRKNTVENVPEGMVSEKIFREVLLKNEDLNRQIGRLEAELEHCKKAGAPQAEHATFAVAAGEK